MSQESLEVKVEETDSKADWTYVGEGQAHLVYAYIGDGIGGNKHSLKGKVLRMKKAAHKGMDESQEKMQTTFRDEILPKLVDSDFLIVQSTLKVRRDWLSRLKSEHDSTRPERRRLADIVEETRQFAGEQMNVILMENMIGGQGNISVEIKVKGFVVFFLFDQNDI